MIIGAGNVAWQLASAFFKAGITVEQVYARNKQSANELAKKVLAEPICSIDDLIETADLYLLCITDDSISSIAENFPPIAGIVAHTSGAKALSTLNANQNCGVFYPLQTMVKNQNTDFNEVPILCEGNSGAVEAALMDLALRLSTNVHAIDSNQRQKLHVAAVFANNFTNHMLAKAYQICTENNIPFRVLKPLIAETVEKAFIENPKLHQTGPAARNDVQTIAQHISLLRKKTDQNLYNTITQSIQNQIDETEL